MTNLNGNRSKQKVLFIVFLFFSWELVTMDSKADVLLISPETTKQYLQSQSIPFVTEEWVGIWRDWLSKCGISFDIAAEPALHSLEHYQFVILSGAICLENSAITSLEKFLSHGGGVLLVAEIGTRHVDGRLRGYQFLAEMLGTAPQPSGIKPNEAIALQLRFGLPGTNAVPPGYYLRLIPQNEPLFLPATPLVTTVGYWASDGYTQITPDQIKRLSGFVIRQLKTSGRIAWFGGNVSGIDGDEVNQSISGVFFNELFDWLSGKPLAAVEAWPNKYQAAMVIQGDIEDRFENVIFAAQVFKKLNVRTTYNILTTLAVMNPDAMKAMEESKGEITIQGDTHDLFTGQSLEMQVYRLSSAVNFISRYTEPPVGLCPPELAYDALTIQVMKQLGLKYLVSNNIADRNYPRYLEDDNTTVASQRLVSFSKGELDDYDLFKRFGLVDPDTITSVMIQDFERIYHLGGLYQLNYHSHILAAKRYVNILDKVITYAQRKGDVWIATASEINDWFRKRDALNTSIKYADHITRLSLKNHSETPINDLVIRVVAPGGVGVEEIAPRKVSKSCTYDVIDQSFLIQLPKLKAGETFEAELIEGGAGTLSSEKKQVLILVIKVVGIITGLFLLWTIYYLIYAKKRKYITAAGYYPVDFPEEPAKQPFKKIIKQPHTVTSFDQEPGESRYISGLEHENSDQFSDPEKYVHFADSREGNGIEAEHDPLRSIDWRSDVVSSPSDRNQLSKVEDWNLDEDFSSDDELHYPDFSDRNRRNHNFQSQDSLNMTHPERRERQDFFIEKNRNESPLNGWNESPKDSFSLEKEGHQPARILFDKTSIEKYSKKNNQTRHILPKRLNNKKNDWI